MVPTFRIATDLIIASIAGLSGKQQQAAVGHGAVEVGRQQILEQQRSE
jgi:hypothetical protein